MLLWNRMLLLIGLLCLLVVLPIPCWSQNSVVVDTSLGRIEGVVDETRNVRVFKGIKYALISDRFRPSTPVPAWKPGTLEAFAAGPACYQDRSNAEPYFLDPGTPLSEDCLFLNIWTPTDPPPDGGYPVMVYIHGGAWVYGSASNALFDGTNLATATDSPSRGVIVVTLQYRLGLLGFLQSPELALENSSGSYGGMNGIADQINALRFIQSVIPAFGGDPDAVTLFGESAGGTSICTLLVTPSAKGLFARAIIQSGNCIMEAFGPLTHEKGLALSAKAMNEVGAKSISDLRTMPVEKLVAGFVKPSIDGAVLTRHPKELFADKQFILDPKKNPNVILGTNSYDCHGPVFFPFIEQSKYKPMLDLRRGQLEAMLAWYFDDRAQGILGLYDRNLSPFLTFANVNADACLHCGIRRMASQLGEAYPTFVYYYEFNPAADVYGQAGHASELINVFGNDIALTRWWVYRQAVSATMQEYWRQAARNEMATESNTGWPVFDPKTKTNYLVIQPSGLIESEVAKPFQSRCDFWLSLWSTNPDEVDDFCNVVKGWPRL